MHIANDRGRHVADDKVHTTMLYLWKLALYL